MSKNTTCPKCGATATGNFCGNCGSALGGRHCTSCGAALPSGARFCTGCGTAVTAQGGSTGRSTGSGGGSGVDPHFAWWAAGGLLVVLILVVAWPIVRPQDVAPTAPLATGAPAAGVGAVDLGSMSPREAADRLFQRVMQAASAGDSAQAAQFLPMAIQAYDRARPLDLHGLFDLSTLQRTAGDMAGARASAEEGLAEDGDHLLLLYAAAQAAQDAGDASAARGYYERLLEAYDAEMATQNLDYEAHSTMLPTARADALAFLGGGP